MFVQWAIVASAKKQLRAESTGDEQDVYQLDAMNWPNLPKEQQIIAQKLVCDRAHNFAAELAAYEKKKRC